MTSFRSSRVVFDDGVRPATLTVEDGKFQSVGHGTADHDFGDLVVMPGLVDTHVHVNEPGRTEWEGFVSATRAAAAGGTTTIVDMPLNSIPPTTSPEALEVKRAAAAGAISVDVAFWGGIVPGSEGSVDALVDAGVCGFKVFTTDSGVPEFPPVPFPELAGIDLGVPLLVHAETTALLGRPGPSYAEYLESRPAAAEADAIGRVAALGGRAHILHVSSAEGVAAIAAGPTSLSGETCPHYLTFTSEDVTGVTFKCAPPIREPGHREALWEGLERGLISMVVSDHSPAPPELKQGDFETAWGGIASLQLRLPLTWAGASSRRLGWGSMVEWLATAPARLAGLDDRKGSIEPGKDADLVVFDPDAVWVVRGDELLHRHPLTPYEGMSVRGRVVGSILAGRFVYQDGAIHGGHGRMLNRR